MAATVELAFPEVDDLKSNITVTVWPMLTRRIWRYDYRIIEVLLQH